MEDNKLIEANNTNFSLNSVNYLDKNEKEISYSFLENISCNEDIQVGDLIKLKGSEFIVRIEHVNYQIKNIGAVDFAGTIIQTNEFVIFNRYNIDKKIEKSYKK